MKRKSSAVIKRKDNYPSKRVTRSMNISPESLTASGLQQYKIEREEDVLQSTSERSTPSLSSDSRSESPSNNVSEEAEAEADTNILIKMEEVKDTLKDGVDVFPGSQSNSDRICQICYKEYSTDRLFENHQKYFHNPEYKLARKLVQNSELLPDEDNSDFYCRVCVRNFTCKSSFRGHLKNVHKMKLKPTKRTLQRFLIDRFKNIQPDPDDPNSNCCVCQKNFSGKYNYRRHLRQAHKIDLKPLAGVQIVNPDAIPDPNDPNYYCNGCERRFSEKSGYLSHIEVVHSVPPVRRQRARKSDELPDEHDPNNYCKVCKKTLGSKRSYRSHLRSIHVMHLKPDTDRVKRLMNADKVPDQHDPNNYCLVCEKTFNRIDSFRVHLRTIHKVTLIPRATKNIPYPSVPDPNITPDEDDPNFHCQPCSKKLRTKTLFRRHLREFHKMSLKPLLSTSIKESGLLPDKNDPNFYCHPCDLKHRTKKEFFSHLQEDHSMDVGSDTTLPDVDDPDSHCCLCDKKFVNGNLYRKHLRRVHRMKFPNKRPQKQLPKIYETSLLLLPEVDDPNNFCRVCDKSFDTKNRYRKHLRASHQMNLVPLTILRIAARETEEEEEMKALSEKLKICGICGKGVTDVELYHHHCEEPTASVQDKPREKEDNIESGVVLIPDENDPNFFCNLCQKESPDRHTFHNHLEFIHKMKLNNRSKEPTFEQVSPENLPDVYDPNHYCKVCKKTYSSRDNYYGHIRLLHNIKIGRPARAHRIPHPELTPDVNDPNLTCCACEKTFVCKSAFRHHLTTIHYMVLKSTKAFRVKGKLVCARPDLKPDINDPDFFCRTCQRTYAQRSTFRYHVINIHQVNVKDGRTKAGRNTTRRAERNTKRPRATKENKVTRSPPVDENLERTHRFPRSTHSAKAVQQ